MREERQHQTSDSDDRAGDLLVLLGDDGKDRGAVHCDPPEGGDQDAEDGFYVNCEFHAVSISQTEPQFVPQIVNDQGLGVQVESPPPLGERGVLGQGREETLYQPVEVGLALFAIR